MADPLAVDLAGLQQALELSQQMIALGESGEWDEVNELDRQRMDILTRSLEGGVAEADKNQASGYLEQIQQLNEALRQRAGQEQEEVGKALRLLQKRKDVSAAYTACQNNPT